MSLSDLEEGELPDTEPMAHQARFYSDPYLMRYAIHTLPHCSTKLHCRHATFSAAVAGTCCVESVYQGFSHQMCRANCQARQACRVPSLRKQLLQLPKAGISVAVDTARLLQLQSLQQTCSATYMALRWDSASC